MGSESRRTKKINEKFLEENPGVAKTVEGGKISKEKVLAGIKSRAEEELADKKLAIQKELETKMKIPINSVSV